MAFIIMFLICLIILLHRRLMLFISPRPHFGLAGKLDPLTPQKGLEKIDNDLKEIYKKDGAPEAWQLRIYNVGHLETAEMRQDIMAFFKKWL